MVHCISCRPPFKVCTVSVRILTPSVLCQLQVMSMFCEQNCSLPQSQEGEHKASYFLAFCHFCKGSIQIFRSNKSVRNCCLFLHEFYLIRTSFLVFVQLGKFSNCENKKKFLSMMCLRSQCCTVKINSWCLWLMHIASPV